MKNVELSIAAGINYEFLIFLSAENCPYYNSINKYSSMLVNLSISAGLEPVLSHTEKSYIVSSYRIFLQIIKSNREGRENNLLGALVIRGYFVNHI